jgi:UDP-2,3-diacylglucosamine hydrolase
MKLGFISDLHLSENMPSITEGFFKFLHTASQELSHLYILGDLFESWIGDDDDSEYALKVIKEINHATRNGLEIFFIHGNRDFLCGQEFALHSNLTLLPDPFLLTFLIKKLLFLMGMIFVPMTINILNLKKRFDLRNGKIHF